MGSNSILKLAITAGKIMLENGGETYRVEDTMMHILKHYNLDVSETFVTSTGIFVSVGSDTMIKRVKSRTIHLEKIALVNDLSRRIVADEVSALEAFDLLKKIEKVPPYPLLIKTLASGLSCFCFSYIFGGKITDCLNSFIVGIILNLVVWFLNKKSVSNFLVNIIGGFVIGFFALLFINFGIGDNMDKVIIGAIMPLVPGVGITNAIRDILEGDFLSGSGRIFDAFMVSVAIATGVGTMLKIWLYIFGGYLIW